MLCLLYREPEIMLHYEKCKVLSIHIAKKLTSKISEGFDVHTEEIFKQF